MLHVENVMHLFKHDKTILVVAHIHNKLINNCNKAKYHINNFQLLFTA